MPARLFASDRIAAGPTLTDQGTPMTVSRRVTMPYAAGLAAAVALAGCTASTPAPPASSSPQPTSATSSTSTTAAPTTSARPSTTTSTPPPSVDPVLAKIPKAARPETINGAEAFVRFYMEQVNAAFTKGTPAPLTGLDGPACKICAAFIDAAEQLRTDKQRHKGVSIEVTAASSNKFSDTTRTVLVWVTQRSVPILDQRGATVDQTKAGKGVFLATLKFDRRWVMSRLQVAK